MMAHRPLPAQGSAPDRTVDGGERQGHSHLYLGHPEVQRGPCAIPGGRTIIVSNRLPVTVRMDGSAVRLGPSSGGLATGLRGVQEQSDALWVGWCGLATAPLAGTARLIQANLEHAGAVPVPLDAGEVAGFYQRYASGVLWPVLHDRTDAPAADPADWETYRAVNQRFAHTVAEHLRPGDQVWVHDYHLLLVPRLLRELCPEARIGFFLHTPFPSPDALATLPESQRVALLDGPLGADVVGFHTPAYVARFIDAVRTTLGRRAHDGVDGTRVRRTQVRAFPMGIDADAFARRASGGAVAAQVGQLRRGGGALLLGIDRLDYTKGIPERLEAFSRLLERSPELHGRVRLLQVAVPSREEVPAYQAVRARVQALVARINARFGSGAWTPVRYFYGSVDALTLSVLYRAADVMLVTPLRDGMNLVAKEFVASRTDDDGVLVLSAHAGAATELRAAVLVDPTHADSLADAYLAALRMSPAERRGRMRDLRERVHAHDVFRWAREFLDALGRDPAPAAGGRIARVPAAVAAPANALTPHAAAVGAWAEAG